MTALYVVLILLALDAAALFLLCVREWMNDLELDPLEVTEAELMTKGMNQ